MHCHRQLAFLNFAQLFKWGHPKVQSCKWSMQNSIIFWPVINPLRSLISIFSLQLHSDPWLPIQTTVWVWWVHWHWSKSLLFPSEICLILLSIIQGMYWKMLKKSHNFFDNLQPKYRHIDTLPLPAIHFFHWLTSINWYLIAHTRTHTFFHRNFQKKVLFFYYWKISFYKKILCIRVVHTSTCTQISEKFSAPIHTKIAARAH